MMVGDVLKTDLPFFDVCVANLPYQVRVYILLMVFINALIFFLDNYSFTSTVSKNDAFDREAVVYIGVFFNMLQ